MQSAALFTDLYELTMMQAYFEEKLHEIAVFDLHFRKLPQDRNFLIACGLDQVLTYLETLSFSREDLDYLESLNLFTSEFLRYLEGFRFGGSIRAMPEGSLVFPYEPLVEVKAPILQAQLVETFVLNQISFQTMIASKGARVVMAAGGRNLVDFGSRRAHGTDAGLKAARALYIVGYNSTSNVEAGRLFGIPVAGTMAHSYVQAHDTEIEAFRAFLRSYPDTILLVDTYDTELGVRNVIHLGQETPDFRVRAVRLDSGDLGALAKQTRRMLDDAGLGRVGIFAGSGLDEYEIDRLVHEEAPIDGFGPGTNVVVSSDEPKLDIAYKLVSFAGVGRLKLSPGKAILPGPKQVFRRYTAGVASGDNVALADESDEGEPMLVEVMAEGKRTSAGRASLDQARDRAKHALDSLPEPLRSLKPAESPYPVELTLRLKRETERLGSLLAAREQA